MKNFMQAMAIIVISYLIYQSPLLDHYEQWREEPADNDSPGQSGPAAHNDSDSADSRATQHLSRADEAEMLAEFEQHYSAPAGCERSATRQGHCADHRQRTLDAFRAQWTDYHMR